jgi:hypothetical protein
MDIKKLITKLAVRWLIRQLEEDSALYYGYQDNIAMSILDEIKNNDIVLRTPRGALSKRQTFIFADDCSVRFLKLWIEKTKEG